jgi:hypothetical protein
MVTRSQAFPSKYLKADDLPQGGKVFKISSLDVETIGTDNEEKYVLRFGNSDKALVLNLTNWDLIAAFAGADSDDWLGHFVVLYPTETPFGGKTVPCIRARRPRQAAQPKPAPKSSKAEQQDADQPTAKPTPAKASPAATDGPEWDDEIPFDGDEG